MSTQKIDFAGLKAQYARIKPEVTRRIQTVLDHGQFILGPEVAELEAALAKRAGAKHAIGVSSGTDALIMALMAEGIGMGDAVFVPSFTFTASAEVVLLLGATPVFVEVDAHTFNIDTADLDRRVGEVAREGKLLPRAVISVDLFGQPADYGALDALCRRHALFLIADAAQSYGAKLGNRAVGALAPATARMSCLASSREKSAPVATCMACASWSTITLRLASEPASRASLFSLNFSSRSSSTARPGSFCAQLRIIFDSDSGCAPPPPPPPPPVAARPEARPCLRCSDCSSS